MKELFSFAVPGEIRAQGRPRTIVRGGHATIYESAEDKSYKGLIQFHAMRKMEEKGLHYPLPTPAKGFKVELVISKAIPKSFSKKKQNAAFNKEVLPQTKPDLDNVAKIYLDALNGIVWKDDSAVTNLSISKEYWSADSVAVIVEYESDQDEA